MHSQNGIDAFYLKCPSISEIRSLSADRLPSLLDANVCGVSASQLFGRSVAIFFHPMRITGEKNLKDKLVLNLVPNRYLPAVFILKNISVDWTEGTRLPPARGKRVPVVEINERSHFTNPQKGRFS
ncbi:hypothetical protein AB1L12_02535 [Peribacillus frigoritolerans]|uniref:hypothetical protein n=1 Tax=Peribacillus frigoritolerans TaxID=450367 RepID=UPI0039A18401